jgi:transcriptional regulator with XRE-family HTH domain
MEERNDAGGDAPATEEAKVRARALGLAIRAARGDVSQVELARRVEVTQSTISIWEKGDRVPTLEQVLSVEQALELPPGQLATHAGFVDPTGVPLAGARSYQAVRGDDVLEMLAAAMTLGLGVRLTNRMVPLAGEDDVFEEEWQLEVSDSAPQLLYATATGDLGA